ncbi:Kinesin-like protein [Quillaja saponaria]|uniref:Kinesin-like protein n=1 Tax=Quillaja saponaria TaxID=32244 RepID=A0AAD7Q1Z0_QUISA|nr:Kinesin-like protein [Quillaja saponaria]
MAKDQVFPFSVVSVVEDFIQQHGSRLSDNDLASRKAEESSLRRYEAAGWLRKMVGVVGGKDLPAQPSEEDLRLGLQNGIILCNVINKVQPGAVPKVVEGPCDSVIIPDGAALSAYRYFENVRNFLVAAEEMGLPIFEASDLEQGGKSARVVNCVLALKSYSEWKQGGKNGCWKYGGSSKPPTCGKQFVWKNIKPFMHSMSRICSLNEKSVDSLSSNQSLYSDNGHDLNEAGSSRSLNTLVHQLLANKKQEEIPIIVESILCKVMEEFEHRLESQNNLVKTTTEDKAISAEDNSVSETFSDDEGVKVKTTTENKTTSGKDNSVSETFSDDEEMEEKAAVQLKKEESHDQKENSREGSRSHLLKQQELVEQQQRDIKELKNTLHHTKTGMQYLQIKYQEEFSNLGKKLRSLAYAASGYRRVLEENRTLYNQVQDLKGNIRVYCRVRPFLPGQSNHFSTVSHIDEGNITITAPSKYGKEGRKSFSFNRVFSSSATQEEVFSDTRPLIRSVLDGYNVCIFAYGQTGSGKTYTMSGPNDLTEESVGVNYRALGDLFFLSEQRKDTIHYDISVQMLEIYNEQVRDLLVTDGVNKRLDIRNSSQNGINVPDANLVSVSSTSDVMHLMNLGQKNRAVSSTAMNDRSSRSHSCLTVHVQGKDLTSRNTLRGCMHLVDLAGSERVDKSEVTGDRLKEAQHINKSLSALGDVISSLAQKNTHVPYRNSKLTQLLQDSLGGQAKTLMFVHISPESDALGETISTLKFAERVSNVELGAARVNKDSADVKELKEQIASLKAALAKKEGEREHSQYSLSSSPERSRTKSSGSSSCGSSPLLLRRRSIGDMSGGRRQLMEETGNREVHLNSASKIKRRSLDLQDMLKHSPPRPPLASPRMNKKEDDKESVSGDWVDKIMVNKDDLINREDHNLLGSWEGDSRQLPDEFDVYKSRFEMSTTDDSDEFDAATSDSSEPDLLWQLNLKVTNIPNGLASKGKKSHPKPAKNPETRIPSLIPSPSRKPPNVVNQPQHRPGRQAGPNDGKRKTGHAK